MPACLQAANTLATRSKGVLRVAAHHHAQGPVLGVGCLQPGGELAERDILTVERDLAVAIDIDDLLLRRGRAGPRCEATCGSFSSICFSDSMNFVPTIKKMINRNNTSIIDVRLSVGISSRGCRMIQPPGGLQVEETEKLSMLAQAAVGGRALDRSRCRRSSCRASAEIMSANSCDRPSMSIDNRSTRPRK